MTHIGIIGNPCREKGSFGALRRKEWQVWVHHLSLTTTCTAGRSSDRKVFLEIGKMSRWRFPFRRSVDVFIQIVPEVWRAIFAIVKHGFIKVFSCCILSSRVPLLF